MKKKYIIGYSVVVVIIIAIPIVMFHCKWIITSDTWFTVILTLLTLFPLGLYKPFEKRMLFIQKRNSPSKVKAYDIMGKSRSQKAYGFNEDLYYPRQVDDDLDKINKIAVILGGIGSGKSRAVYEYITKRSQYKFDYIYIVAERDDIKIINDGIKSSREKSLIVVDDVHEFYPEQKENLQKLFETVYEKENLTAIITIATEHDISLNVDGECFYSYINRLNCVLKKASEGIAKIEIDEIKRNDEVHKWCMGNLRRTDFSPIIGTYIKPLESQILKKTEDLFKNEDAVDVLTAYTTIKKFRNDKGQYIKYIFFMYIAQRSYNTKKNLGNFNNGLRILGNLGYIDVLKDMKLFCFDNRKVEKNEALSSIVKLIENNQINWGCVNEKVQEKDTYLYNAFQAQALLGDKLKTNTTEDYLSHGKECEIKQVEALIRIDKNNPDYYARAVTKSTYTEEVVEVVKERMLEHFFVEKMKVNEDIINSDRKKDALALLISVIIGRTKLKLVEDYQKEIEKYDNMGISPTINTVGELLLIALSNYRLKDEMCKYANSLLTKYRITPSVFYYRRIEQLNTNSFDIENVRNAYLCRQNDYEGVKSFKEFCDTILRKAIIPEKIDILFDKILPEIDKSTPPIITFKRNSIMYLINNIRSTQHKSKSDILIHLLKKLQLYPERISEDENINSSNGKNSNLKSLFIIAIKESDEFDKARQIYDMGLHILEPDEQDSKYRRLLAMSLFGQINEDFDAFGACHTIFLELIEENDDRINTTAEANLKLFNKFLFNAPSYELAKDLFYNATVTGCIDTINALLSVAKRTFKNEQLDIKALKFERWADEALKVDEYRANKGIDYDPYYLSHFYDIADKLIRCNKNNEPIFEKIRNVIYDINKKKNGKKEFLNNDILKANKINIITEEKEIIVEAKNILDKMKIGKIVDSDICTHLLKKSEQFRTPYLQEIINMIIENENKINRPKVYYYCNRFKYNLLNNTYNKEDGIDIEYLKNDIEKALVNLMRIGEDLFKNNSDIFFTVMTFLDFKEAKDIVLFAKELSVKYRYNDKIKKIFRSDLIIGLCAKIETDDTGVIKKQSEEIQLLINNNPTLRFNDYQRRKLSSLASHRKFFIYYPLMNPHKATRYFYWDNEIEEGTIRNAFGNDIQGFIKLEVYDITCNLNKQEILDETRLIQALEILSERTDLIDDFVNTGGFIGNRYRPQNATQYNHFFDAFWNLYAFKSDNKKKWGTLAYHFGYIIE